MSSRSTCGFRSIQQPHDINVQAAPTLEKLKVCFHLKSLLFKHVCIVRFSPLHVKFYHTNTWSYYNVMAHILLHMNIPVITYEFVFL